MDAVNSLITSQSTFRRIKMPGKAIALALNKS